jgi:hypothetical protein
METRHREGVPIPEKCQLSWKEYERKGKDRENAVFGGEAGLKSKKALRNRVLDVF